ncbi:hypothetical protein [Methylobacterium sp. P1-11]|uniref:hypothetical protein n=1 Tax=Methylobacterium sp. P1-11 TaxID=2024616 RepID=UPI0011F05D89|nr:hypothetical protein [Methylobacterium sp. P1-11]
MSARRLIVVGAMLGLSGSLPALGRSAIHPDPAQAVADRTDYIAKSGKTVPRPDKLDPNENSAIQRRTPDQMRDDAITRGICVGCSR